MLLGCRSVVRGMLSAVAFCHERRVAHGSISSGCFLLSSFEDRRARQVSLTAIMEMLKLLQSSCAGHVSYESASVGCCDRLQSASNVSRRCL